ASRELAISSETISKYVIETIQLAYELVWMPFPEAVWAHYDRAIASSTAFLTGVSIPNI
ncbi:hypothetical protein JRQ81_002027, partial [Phrynocephalus forsythii]